MAANACVNSGSSGSAVFGPLPRNQRRRYTLTIQATARDETMTIERRFRSGTLLLLDVYHGNSLYCVY